MHLPPLLPALRSAKLALALLLLMALAAAAGTAGRPLLSGLGALLTANILFCTLQRLRAARARGLRSITDPAMHLALVLVVLGGAGKALVGTTWTAVVPVGTETGTGYDQKRDADVPLGFAMRVEGLDLGHYPFRALVGVSQPETGRKLGLVEVGDGAESASAEGGVAIRFGAVDRELGRVHLHVRTPAAAADLALGLTAGPAAAAEAGGLRFTVVAFKDEVKSVAARLRVTHPGGGSDEFRLSPNEGRSVGGTRICLTAWGRDRFGIPYAGFQLSRDQWSPLFWAGCILLSCALPAHYLALARRRRET